MYKDLISYHLADGVTSDQLLSAAETVIESWMNKQPGFMGWEIHEPIGGEYTDIVYWKDEASAQEAEKAMQAGDPSFTAWYECYEMTSISTKKLQILKRFNGEKTSNC